MQVSDTRALSDSLVSTGFGYDRTERADHYASVLGRVLARSRGIRRIGSAALDLCWVADGRLDAHWEEQLKPWDTAAASLIIQEAGGTITSAAGTDFDLEAPSVVASNGLIHRELVSVLDLGP
jgi:myo-inositol-1(or 4)-monophosphatase